MLAASAAPAPAARGLYLISEISRMSTRLGDLQVLLRRIRGEMDASATEEISADVLRDHLDRVDLEGRANEEAAHLNASRRAAGEALCTFLADKIRLTHNLHVSMSFDGVPEEQWTTESISRMIVKALGAAAKSNLMGRNARVINGLGKCNTCSMPGHRFAVQGSCPCFEGRPACTCSSDSGLPFHPTCTRCFLQHYGSSWASQIAAFVSSHGGDGDVDPFVACPTCHGVLCPFDAFAYDAQELQATQLSWTAGLNMILQDHERKIESIITLQEKHVQHYAKPASLLFTKASGVQRELIEASKGVFSSLEAVDAARVCKKRKESSRRICDWCELLAHYPKTCKFKRAGLTHKEAVEEGNKWAELHGTREMPTDRKSGKKRPHSRRHRSSRRNESVHSSPATTSDDATPSSRS
jgi:hypothetical protein